MSEFIAEAFTNDLGQVIQPGEDVLYIGTWTRTVKIKNGKFGGVFYGDRYVAIYDENNKYVGRELKKVVTGVKITDVETTRFKYDYKTHSGVHEDVITSAFLPLKRVYKIDTPMKEFAGKAF